MKTTSTTSGQYYAEFVDHYRALQKSNGFETEFHRVVASVPPMNLVRNAGNKNRYDNVLAYESTRGRLHSSPCGETIASTSAATAVRTASPGDCHGGGAKDDDGDDEDEEDEDDDDEDDEGAPPKDY